MSKSLSNIKIKKKGNLCLVSINPKLYSLDVIYSVAYVLIDRAYVSLDGDVKKKVMVELKPKKKYDLEKLGNEFKKELLNYLQYKVIHTRTCISVFKGKKYVAKYSIPKLLELAKNKVIKKIGVSRIHLGQDFWKIGMTIEEWLKNPKGLHKIKAESTDIKEPIIVLTEPKVGLDVLDGLHRVAKARLLNIKELNCVEFTSFKEIEDAKIK